MSRSPQIISDQHWDKTRRLHTCSICGARGNWSDAWSWHGSLKELEAGIPIIKVCSDACKAKAQARGEARR